METQTMTDFPGKHRRRFKTKPASVLDDIGG
jgi:hypothetical protein